MERVNIVGMRDQIEHFQVCSEGEAAFKPASKEEKSESLPEDILECLLSEPVMKITDGEPDYKIEKEDGPPGYEQEVLRLFIDNVRDDVFKEFQSNYNGLADQFEKWALAKGFVSSQILEGDENSLVFEVTGIAL